MYYDVYCNMFHISQYHGFNPVVLEIGHLLSYFVSYSMMLYSVSGWLRQEYWWLPKPSQWRQDLAALSLLMVLLLEKPFIFHKPWTDHLFVNSLEHFLVPNLLISTGIKNSPNHWADSLISVLIVVAIQWISLPCLTGFMPPYYKTSDL